MHIDDFIDDMDTDAYASWFFSIKRLPAILQQKFKQYTNQYKLYCTYEGKRYRVTGCSRMGDIWLHSKLDWTEHHTPFYEERVDVEDCSDWGKDK